MSEQSTITITPRWLSLTDACAYAPAVGKKKLVGLLRKGDIYGMQSGDQGKWIVDRISLDNYFLRDAVVIKTALAEMMGTR